MEVVKELVEGVEGEVGDMVEKKEGRGWRIGDGGGKGGRQRWRSGVKEEEGKEVEKVGMELEEEVEEKVEEEVMELEEEMEEKVEAEIGDVEKKEVWLEDRWRKR